MSSCLDTLGPDAVGCTSVHCNQYQETTAFHMVCQCLNWQGNPIPNCSVKDSNYPIPSGQCFNPNTNTVQDISSQACAGLGLPWFWQTCYCCCTCFSANTPVAGPDGFRAIGGYLVGDQVLAAAGAGGSWSWTPQTVQFSSGTPPTTGDETGPIMLLVEFGGGQSVVASTNQLFVVPGGKVKRANQLVPGSDQLVDADGKRVAIHRVSSGYYKGAVHHLATSTPSYEEWDGSLDDHLINANGIVGGDYLLQLFQDTPKMKPHLAAADAPVIGTQAYTAAAPDLLIKPFVVGESSEVEGTEVSVPHFRVHAASAAYIPDGAMALFSPDQEIYLMDPDIPKRGFSDVTNVQITDYYIKLYRGFFPDVSIYLDWENMRPNLFAFSQYGQATVVISGEFLRLAPLYGEAIVLALAVGVANCHLAADTCDLGHCLYDGISGILPQVLMGGQTLGAAQSGGQAQLGKLLSMLAAKDGNAAPGFLAASCLASTIDAAISGDPLPACAGGAPASLFSLASATYSTAGLTVTFSLPLDFSATNLADYQLSPSGIVEAAANLPDQEDSVLLSVTLPAGKYILNVGGIVAANGAQLDPTKSSTSFTVTES